MMKFFKDGVLLALVEEPNWVHLLDNGTYGLCSYNDAEGVAIDGVVYNLDDNTISDSGTVYFKEVSRGEYMMQQNSLVDELILSVLGV